MSGYCCVSKVLAAGAGMEEYRPGDVVFHYGSHSRYQCIRPGDYNLICKVPQGNRLLHNYYDILHLYYQKDFTYRMSK